MPRHANNTFCSSHPPKGNPGLWFVPVNWCQGYKKKKKPERSRCLGIFHFTLDFQRRLWVGCFKVMQREWDHPRVTALHSSGTNLLHMWATRLMPSPRRVGVPKNVHPLSRPGSYNAHASTLTCYFIVLLSCALPERKFIYCGILWKN